MTLADATSTAVTLLSEFDTHTEVPSLSTATGVAPVPKVCVTAPVVAFN